VRSDLKGLEMMIMMSTTNHVPVSKRDGKQLEALLNENSEH